MLAIEVSVTTLSEDRKKLAIYARAGVPTVWILDVPGRKLEIYSDRRGESYASHVDVNASVDVPVLHERWTIASLID